MTEVNELRGFLDLLLGPPENPTRMRTESMAQMWVEFDPPRPPRTTEHPQGEEATPRESPPRA